jgi:hypothetical protein
MTTEPRPAVPLRSGLDHYDLARDPVDHAIDKVLPDDPRPVHAVAVGRRNPMMIPNSLRHRDVTSKDPAFLDAWQYEDSLCGRDIKVVLGIAFNPADPDACAECVASFQRGATEPPAGRSRRERETAAQDATNRAAQAHADSFDELNPETFEEKS